VDEGEEDEVGERAVVGDDVDEVVRVVIGGESEPSCCAKRKARRHLKDDDDDDDDDDEEDEGEGEGEDDGDGERSGSGSAIVTSRMMREDVGDAARSRMGLRIRVKRLSRNGTY
jgi:hypothetical protein